MSSSDGGRRITAAAAGGAVLLLSGAAVALWPRTYGTAATLVLDNGAAITNPVALAGRIEAALLEREALASVAMDLPPELRSPDPIGRLRGGIRVQSRGASGFTVEFRGSDPQSVQRIANHLAERAVKLVPKLAVTPADQAPALALAQRSRAVTEFLTAHPEVTLEPPSGKPSSGADSGLDALRNERRQLEQLLAAPATDNPYAEADQSPEVLARRLTELKNAIGRREAALKQPRPATVQVSPELTTQWRSLLADLASAQAAVAAHPAKVEPSVTARITTPAPLPDSPLTPNRLVLSIVAALLTMAAAMIAYVLPRRSGPAKRSGRSEPPRPRSEPPPAAQTAQNGAAPGLGNTLPIGNLSVPQQAAVPQAPSEAPNAAQRSPSDPPNAAQRSPSDPPVAIAAQRTVVLSGGPSASSAPPKRSHTVPGGLQAPDETPMPGTAPVPHGPHSPPAAPLFGSRPPPGAGSYSVSSSHPPPMVGGRVEHLQPLPSAHPPGQTSAPATRRSPVPVAPEQPIVSRPPALDPDAETWAARFETPPPAPPAEEAPRKRSGRWKTQVMGSMVPLEVAAAREAPPPRSEGPTSLATSSPDVGDGVSQNAKAEPTPPPAPAATPEASARFHEVMQGWTPQLNPEAPWFGGLRDAVQQHLASRSACVAVTGGMGQDRAQLVVQLGLALSRQGIRVLLIDADFDRPELHQVLALSVPAGAGFSQQLLRRQKTQQSEPWMIVRCSSTLEALVEGRMRSPGLLTSGSFETAVRALRGNRHLVLIHAPSLDRPMDLRPLVPVTEGLIVVSASKPASFQVGSDVLSPLT